MWWPRCSGTAKPWQTLHADPGAPSCCVRILGCEWTSGSSRRAMNELKNCPICGKPAAEGLRPFCSRRCADVDLGRWLTGVYRVPSVEDDAEVDEAEE